MSDERVIAYLRFRGEAQPPTDLVPRVMVAVDAAPVSRSPFAAFFPAAVAVGVVTVVAIVALILGQEPNVGPGPTESTEAQPSPASVDELRAALESAIGVLREAPGVEGVSTSSVLDELSGATWFSWRPNGDQVVIMRTDVDVAETAWWLDPDGQPPARGVNVTTSIHLLVGDESYVTDADAGAWVAGSREEAPPAVTIPTGILDGEVAVEDAFLGTADGDVTVTRGPDGGTTWVLTAPYRDGMATSEWDIAPDGGLRTWSVELVGVTPTVEDAPFITSHLTEFMPVTDPEPIEAPDTDLPPDPAALGLPPGFPLETASSAAPEIDYVAYVETALDAMEAYHWNTAAIDWDAARAAALDGLPDYPTAGQAYQRIQRAIRTFDTLTTLVRPEDVPTGSGAPAESAGPRAERLGDVGYLGLPALDAGGPDDVLGYLQDGRTAMQSIEATAPACGWIVDVRETAFGAYPPLFGVVAGLLGEGRVITFDSALGDWWVEVNDDGTVLVDGEERTADILDSPAVAAATADDERQAAEFAAMLASAVPHLPADRDAPVVVLTSNSTTAAGEQLVVGFRGRPATRFIGGVTAGSPHGQMSLEMVDGARLRIPVSTLVDRAGTTHDSNLVPDENVAVLGGTDGDDPAIDAAVEWLEGQPGCS